ncbi:hypothetical protein MSUIS_03250 [Mycoplasma suis KI3806]|uniref:Uncharacterized protein n=1 Tax=Mycoplasma suis (strain KI_3806) TaxID=708248 RepID=F0V3J6_MYCS3|nr:hypothetical protein [Mycoplasma suis]CBZ40418.1 hypothetical protein MSUIS_03250 [Mycoplasma suis KI3806]
MRRESFNDSLVLVPNSFYEVNKDYLKSLGFEALVFEHYSLERKMNFGIEKDEIKNNPEKLKWVNEFLTHYKKLESDFKLDTTTSYYDQNRQCIKHYGLSDFPVEVNTITGGGTTPQKSKKIMLMPKSKNQEIIPQLWAKITILRALYLQFLLSQNRKNEEDTCHSKLFLIPSRKINPLSHQNA